MVLWVYQAIRHCPRQLHDPRAHPEGLRPLVPQANPVRTNPCVTERHPPYRRRPIPAKGQTNGLALVRRRSYDVTHKVSKRSGRARQKVRLTAESSLDVLICFWAWAVPPEAKYRRSSTGNIASGSKDLTAEIFIVLVCQFATHLGVANVFVGK